MAKSDKGYTYGESLEINDGTRHIIYSVISGEYFHGTGYGIVIKQSNSEGTFFAVAEDITCSKSAILDLLRCFHSEQLEFCHLRDVLEDILPIM